MAESKIAEEAGYPQTALGNLPDKARTKEQVDVVTVGSQHAAQGLA
jgi:hypothetical protein